MSKVRVAVVALTLSAAAFTARMMTEGYSENAIIPTRGDMPTVGFGSTYRPDGSRVQRGDRIEPVQAVRWALAHFQRDEAKIKGCIGEDVQLTQGEFDVYSKLAYNIGAHTFCTNKETGGPGVIPRHLRARDYRGACDAILLYKRAGGFDCSIPGNKVCSGVWKDRLKLHAECIAEQEGA